MPNLKRVRVRDEYEDDNSEPEEPKHETHSILTPEEAAAKGIKPLKLNIPKRFQKETPETPPPAPQNDVLSTPKTPSRTPRNCKTDEITEIAQKTPKFSFVFKSPSPTGNVLKDSNFANFGSGKDSIAAFLPPKIENEKNLFEEKIDFSGNFDKKIIFGEKTENSENVSENLEKSKIFEKNEILAEKFEEVFSEKCSISELSEKNSEKTWISKGILDLKIVEKDGNYQILARNEQTKILLVSGILNKKLEISENAKNSILVPLFSTKISEDSKKSEENEKLPVQIFNFKFKTPEILEEFVKICNEKVLQN